MKRTMGLGRNQRSPMMGHGEIDVHNFLDGIGAYAFKEKSKLQFAAPVDTTTKTQKHTQPWHQVAFSSLRSIIKMLVRPPNSIEKFRGAATSSNHLLSDLQNVAKLQEAYTKLEQAAILINSSYSMQLIVILIIKFTTLTSLLYICCMMVIE